MRSPVILVIIVLCTLMGCRGQAPLTAVATWVNTDSLFARNVQLDSIYIAQQLYVERLNDTVRITTYNTEYRYRLIHDTVRLVQRDSIPYTVTVTRNGNENRLWNNSLSAYVLCIFLGVALATAYRWGRRSAL